MSIFVKEKVIMCPLECLMSILLICSDVFYSVIVSDSNLRMHFHPPKENLNAELYETRGKKDHV